MNIYLATRSCTRLDDGSEDSFWREEVVRIPGGNCE